MEEVTYPELYWYPDGQCKAWQAKSLQSSLSWSAPVQVTSWLPTLSVPGTQTLWRYLFPGPSQETLQEDHSLQHPQVGVVDSEACKQGSKI